MQENAENPETTRNTRNTGTNENDLIFRGLSFMNYGIQAVAAGINGIA